MVIESTEDRWSKTDFRVACVFGAAAALPTGHALVQPITWTTMKVLDAAGLDPIMQLLVGFPTGAISLAGTTTVASVAAGAVAGEVFHRARSRCFSGEGDVSNEPQ